MKILTQPIKTGSLVLLPPINREANSKKVWTVINVATL